MEMRKCSFFLLCEKKGNIKKVKKETRRMVDGVSLLLLLFWASIISH